MGRGFGHLMDCFQGAGQICKREGWYATWVIFTIAGVDSALMFYPRIPIGRFQMAADGRYSIGSLLHLSWCSYVVSCIVGGYLAIPTASPCLRHLLGIHMTGSSGGEFFCSELLYDPAIAACHLALLGAVSRGLLQRGGCSVGIKH